MSEYTVPIRELAARVDRQVSTVRKWDTEGHLPEELKPYRDSRGRRFWSETQVEAVVRWMNAERRVISSAIPVDLNEDQMARYLEGVRKKRGAMQIISERLDALEEDVREIRRSIGTDKE